jgi:hypothetical protein
MIKEAIATMDLSMDDVRDGFQQIRDWFGSVSQMISDKTQYLRNSPQAAPYVQQLDGIWEQFSNFGAYATQQLAQLEQGATQIEQGMQALAPNSMFINGKRVPIQFEPDPEQPGWEIATVTVNGKKYEVQEDESTGQRSLKEMDVNAGIAAPAPIDTSKLDANTVNDIWNELVRRGLAKAAGSTRTVIYRIAALTPDMQQYIDMISKNPDALQKFIADIKAKRDAFAAQPVTNTPAAVTPPPVAGTPQSTVAPAPNTATPPSGTLTMDKPSEKAPASAAPAPKKPSTKKPASKKKKPTTPAPQQSKVVGNIPEGLFQQESVKFNLKMHKNAKKS